MARRLFAQRQKTARRSQRQLADDAEKDATEATSFFASPDYVPPKMFNTRDGSYLLITPDEARALLNDVIADRWDHKTGPMLAGLEVQLENMPEDVLELHSEWLRVACSPALVAAVLAERSTPKPKIVTREELAREASADISVAIAAIERDPKNIMKNGKPKLQLVCAELLRRGYFPREIMDQGYNRGTVVDARVVVRAEKIRAGEPLPKNLEIKPINVQRAGNKYEGAKGPLAAAKREASAIVAAVTPILAPAVKRGKIVRKRGVAGNQFEAFGANGDVSLEEAEE